MSLDKKPFVAYRTDEEREADKSRTLSLKLNEHEDEELEKDMRLMDIGVDSSAVKLLMSIGRKVIREQIPESSIRYLVSPKRIRYDGRKRK